MTQPPQSCGRVPEATEPGNAEHWFSDQLCSLCRKYIFGGGDAAVGKDARAIGSLGVLKSYLLPTFREFSLRDLTPLSVQRYFSTMATSGLAHESRDKIRDLLSSVLRSAIEYDLLARNPVEIVRVPPRKEEVRNETNPS